ncbi:hypothetical protein KY363_06610, partial [Candidatus Woesearchaeota archaeon]|nr:hypothetical protein [Candidatus Woesearchaeota archaeon]
MQYNTAKQVLEFIERNGIQDKRPRPPQCSDKLMQYQEYMTYRLPGLERSESIFRQICKKLPSVYHPEGSTSCHLLGICIGSYSQDDLETSLEEFRFDQTAAPGIRLLFVNGKYETTINIAIEKPNSMGLLLLSQLGQLGYDNITHEKDSLQDSYHCAGDLERFFGGCWA